MTIDDGQPGGEEQSSDIAMTTCPRHCPGWQPPGRGVLFALSDITGPETRSCHFPGCDSAQLRVCQVDSLCDTAAAGCTVQRLLGIVPELRLSWNHVCCQGTYYVRRSRAACPRVNIRPRPAGRAGSRAHMATGSPAAAFLSSCVP